MDKYTEALENLAKPTSYFDESHDNDVNTIRELIAKYNKVSMAFEEALTTLECAAFMNDPHRILMYKRKNQWRKEFMK